MHAVCEGKGHVQIQGHQLKEVPELFFDGGMAFREGYEYYGVVTPSYRFPPRFMGV